MADESLKTILDREASRVQIAQSFSPSLDLLREVTDYGTHLIARCFHSSEKQLADVIVLIVFLKHVVEMLDAIEVLVRECAVQPARLEARSLFEASVYLDFLLNADTSARAHAYYAWNIRRQRVWARRALDTSERRAYEKALGEDYVDHATLHPEMEDEARRLDATANELLARAAYAEFDAQFEAESEKRGHDPLWHAIFGFRSLRAVAKEVGRFHEYAVFYSLDSEVAHSSSYRQHFRVEGDRGVLHPLRNPEGLGTLLKVALSTTFHTYRAAIRRYRPAEDVAFNAKYLSEWRARFRSIPHVDVKVKVASTYS